MTLGTFPTKWSDGFAGLFGRYVIPLLRPTPEARPTCLCCGPMAMPTLLDAAEITQGLGPS